MLRLEVLTKEREAFLVALASFVDRRVGLLLEDLQGAEARGEVEGVRFKGRGYQ